jgi:hypothetical protein
VDWLVEVSLLEKRAISVFMSEVMMPTTNQPTNQLKQPNKKAN